MFLSQKPCKVMIDKDISIVIHFAKNVEMYHSCIMILERSIIGYLLQVPWLCSLVPLRLGIDAPWAGHSMPLVGALI